MTDHVKAAGFEGFIAAQVASFQQRAAELRRYGAQEAAESPAQAALDLERSFRKWWLEELSISEAATEAGYSPERLRDLIREGRVAPAAESKRLRLRRCDLPRKVAPERSASLDDVAERLKIA
jgi:hypothetical protein